jgi:predicted aspartyl protease
MRVKRGGGMKWLLTGAIVALLVLPVRVALGDGADYLQQGNRSLALGDYRRALRSFSEAVRLMPDSAQAWHGVGLSKFRLGATEAMTDPAMLSEAVSAFSTALLLKPDSAEDRFQLGMVYLALDNREMAERETKELARFDPTLAKKLQAAIDGYRAPLSFHEVGGRDDPDEHMTKVTITGNQVVVPATIGFGDKMVQVNLLLDTGASSTVISPDCAVRLGVKPGNTGKGMAQVVGGAVIATGIVKVGYIKVGPRTRTGLNIQIVPHNGPPFAFDGLLGMDFLRGLSYRIDFQRSLIIWSN